MAASNAKKQNVTISISPETLRKARILAARRSTSISGLLAEQIEMQVVAEEAWERSESSALALLEPGFHLGGLIPASRDEWHERTRKGVPTRPGNFLNRVLKPARVRAGLSVFKTAKGKLTSGVYFQSLRRTSLTLFCAR